MSAQLQPAPQLRRIAAMNDSNQLGELIDAVMSANGWTLRDLQRRSREVGHPAAHSTFDRMRKTPVEVLKASTVEMLALTLGVSKQSVTRAALATMGIQFDAPSEDLAAAVRMSPDLTAHDKRLLVGMLDLMRPDESEQDDDGQADPEPPKPLPFPSGEAVEDDPGAGQKSDDEFDLEEMLKRGAASMQRGPRQRDLIERDFPDDEGSQDPDDYK